MHPPVFSGAWVAPCMEVPRTGTVSQQDSARAWSTGGRTTHPAVTPGLFQSGAVCVPVPATCPSGESACRVHGAELGCVVAQERQLGCLRVAVRGLRRASEALPCTPVPELWLLSGPSGGLTTCPGVQMQSSRTDLRLLLKHLEVNLGEQLCLVRHSRCQASACDQVALSSGEI